MTDTFLECALSDIESFIDRARIVNQDLANEYFSIDPEGQEAFMLQYYDAASTRCDVVSDYLYRLSLAVANLREQMEGVANEN